MNEFEGLLPTPWFGSERSELPPATPWLIAQLAYDRIRKQLREDGLNGIQTELRLNWAAQQILGKNLADLHSDVNFALFLEQVIQGNACPHY